MPDKDPSSVKQKRSSPSEHIVNSNLSKNSKHLQINSDSSSSFNNSTMSVPQKLKEKYTKVVNQKKTTSKDGFKKVLKESQISREDTKRSLSTSMKRSFNEDVVAERERRLSKSRLSETRKERDTLQKELVELRKINAHLNIEMDKMKRKYESREEHMIKFREIKNSYKDMIDKFE